MSMHPSPALISLFETALNEFEKLTGTNLAKHQIIDKLGNCELLTLSLTSFGSQPRISTNFEAMAAVP